MFINKIPAKILELNTEVKKKIFLGREIFRSHSKGETLLCMLDINHVNLILITQISCKNFETIMAQHFFNYFL